MRMMDILEKAAKGQPLSREEIAYFVKGVTSGEIPDYQITALLMAIRLLGLSEEETVYLTDEMAKSGDCLSPERFGSASVDKHSSGGIGDKTTLIVAPLAAALGCTVAKMSGRGLGFTGGTIDKLESIPGYKTSLPPDEFDGIVKRVGMAVVGQSGALAPADKRLYALRDVTATVESIPLIAASIMSKKIAAGASSIVLDVKVGSGAFMKELTAARELAELMVKIGRGCGRRVRAVLTDMDIPLGSAVGNALEVKEAVSILSGDEGEERLRTLSVTLAAHMASLSLSIPQEEAMERAEEALRSGAALQKMKEWVKAQGGDIRVIDDASLLPTAAYTDTVFAEADGYFVGTEASQIGRAAMLLGAGREKSGDTIDPAAGLVLTKKVGEAVSVGEPLAVLHTNDKEKLLSARAVLASAIYVEKERKQAGPLILGVAE